MSIDNLSAHLVRLEIFQDLSPLQITEIVRRAERVIYKPGQLLITDGEAGEGAVLIVAGEAVRAKGPLSGLASEAIEPGSLLGEMAMLVETEHASTVVAVTPVRALRISRHAILDMMLDDPRLAEHFVAKLTRRLHRIAADMRGVDDILAGVQDRISGPDIAGLMSRNSNPAGEGASL